MPPHRARMNRMEHGTYLHFHASTQELLLPQTDSACRHPANSAGIHDIKHQQALPPGHIPCRAENPRARLVIHDQIDNDDIFLTYEDDSGKSRLILDSTAHPTHHNSPVSSTTRLHHPTYTNTANHTRCPVTNSGHIATNSPTHRIFTTAIISPNMPDTLISVRDATCRGGSVIFTDNTAFRAPTASLRAILRSETPLTTWCRGEYMVHSTAHLQDDPVTAYSASLRIRHIQIVH